MLTTPLGKKEGKHVRMMQSVHIEEKSQQGALASGKYRKSRMVR